MLKEYLSNIANAIRAKNHKTDKINARDFASEIMGIQIPEEPGDVASDFWELYQEAGNRTDYTGAFAGSGWTDETFTPRYNIRPTTAAYMFYFAKNIKNLKQLLEDAGVVLDTSECTGFNNMFLSADGITHVPEISTVSCAASTTEKAITKLFNWNTLLVEIEKVIFKNDGSQILTGCFEGLSYLKDVVIEGKIGSTINMKSSSRLTKNSIISVVNALYENASNKTITFSKTAINREFGINVDDQSTWPEGSEFYTLRYSKANWSFAYA